MRLNLAEHAAQRLRGRDRKHAIGIGKSRVQIGGRCDAGVE
jgi:hypothetical protein